MHHWTPESCRVAASRIIKNVQSEWVKVAQLCLTLCDPIDCSLPSSSFHGIHQASILECVAYPFSRGSSWPRNWTRVSCITGRSFTDWATREALKCTGLMANFSAFSTFSADLENRFTINKQALGASNRNKQCLTSSKSNLDHPKSWLCEAPMPSTFQQLFFWNKYSSIQIGSGPPRARG